MVRAERMTKAEALRHWSELAPRQSVAPRFGPVPYGTRGSQYGYCGLRIDGSQEFIDAVLSNMKGVLTCENHRTRIGINYQQVTDMQTQQPRVDQFCCYVRVHVRGQGRPLMLAAAVPGLFEEETES